MRKLNYLLLLLLGAWAASRTARSPRSIHSFALKSSSQPSPFAYNLDLVSDTINEVNSPKYKNKAKRNSHNIEEKKKQLEKLLQLCRTQATSINKLKQTLDIQLSLTDINQLITVAGRLNKNDEALEIFRSIPKLGFQTDLMSYNNIIWSAGNVGKVELAKTLFSELLDGKQLKPNVYTFGSLMHGCAKVKAYKQALAYLDLMNELHITPNQIVFTSAMEACAEAGQYKEALNIMNQMSFYGMKPDTTMINAAIKACSLAGVMDEADSLAEILREYGTMDVFTYHTLMMGNTKLGRHYRVLALYDEAIASSALLDGGVYSLAMLAALNCGLFSQVALIADKARESGVLLTEAAYTILIQAYAELENSQSTSSNKDKDQSQICSGEKAITCLDRMIDEGLRPNVITYAAVMSACRKRSDIVIGLLDRMKKENIVPNTVVMTTVIDSLAQSPDGKYTDAAYDMLLDMERNGPEPNIYTYNTITRAFAEAGRIEEAMAVLNSIKRRGLEPDRFTFTTLLIACGRKSNSSRVSEIMAMMRSSGIVPDEIAYGAAIDAHRRAGDSLRAVECLHDMYKNKIDPSAAHYNLVLRTLKSQGYVDKMFQMVIAITSKDKDVKINSNTFELVIEALLEENKWKESLLLVKTMDKLSFTPSISVYTTLIEQLEKARQYKVVFALYRMMARDGYSFYENNILNGVFKRLVNLAAVGIDADLQRAVSEVSRMFPYAIDQIQPDKIIEEIIQETK